MLDQIRSIFGFDSGPEPVERPTLDKKLAAAALMVQVMAADGRVRPEEMAKMKLVLLEHYGIAHDDVSAFIESAQAIQGDAVDLYGFTSILKRDMNEAERLGLIEDLWEMVYADGELHEFEDNVVWRVAELVGIQSRQRMELKQRVLARANQTNG